MEDDKSSLLKFERDLDELEIVLSDSQKEQFIAYYELLILWNAKCNLTAITDYEEVFQKHFIDSLTLKKGYDFVKKEVSMIDVGTGAGFPGIPLKIAYPDFHVVLLDSLKKRVDFLNHIISELHLTHISVIHSRAEDAARLDEFREKFDLCVSRAVANLSTLSEYCIPFVREGGYFISYKADIPTDEMNHAEYVISILGGKLKMEQSSFMLPDSEIKRNLIVIEKINKTPDQYPRRAGIPSKKPLLFVTNEKNQVLL